MSNSKSSGKWMIQMIFNDKGILIGKVFHLHRDGNAYVANRQQEPEDSSDIKACEFTCTKCAEKSIMRKHAIYSAENILENVNR